MPNREARLAVHFVLPMASGAEVRDDDPLANNEYIVVIDLMHTAGRASQIFLAVRLSILCSLRPHSPVFLHAKIMRIDEKRGRCGC